MNVFVYGTLRQNEVNHHYLDGAICLARQCWVNGVMYDTGLGYPTMIKDKNQRIYGELYQVNENQLDQIDWLEGYGGESVENDYNRVFATVHTDFGEMQAYVYIYPESKVKNFEMIRYGDWKCHLHLKEESFLYFAYGSCMDHERFQKQGVDHLFRKLKGCGVVQGYSLSYTRPFADGGRADLIESSEWVEGKIYEVNQEALKYLFLREGVDTDVYRPAFIDVMIEGVEYKNVLTFLVIHKEDEVAPPAHYAKEIIRGAHGIVSERYYSKLINELKSKFNIEIEI